MPTSSCETPLVGWEQYQYSPLDHKAQSIRLLRVLPRATKSRPLSCGIYHADISSIYTCVSYVWGPPEPSLRILVNGKLLWVRRNLFDFLKQYSKGCTEKLLWIDAICIDQKSISERNHQVRQMGQIFSEAQAVISWLGNGTGPHRGIARFLSQPQSNGRDFYEFISSEYWDRAWITQEVTLAKRVVLMANDKQLDVEALLDRIDLDQSNGSSYTDRCMVLNRTALLLFKTKSLLHLLYMFRTKECEQPRDRIFSLLALCGEGSDIQVDYSWSSKELTRHILSCCPKSFCWCSVKTLCDVLNRSDPLLTQSDELPFAQFIVTKDRQLEGLPKRMDIALDSVCKECSGTKFLRILTTLDHTSTNDGTRELNLQQVKAHRWRPCTIQPTEDGTAVRVRLTLSTLLSIARKIDRDGICDGPSLQVCSQGSNDLAIPAFISCRRNANAVSRSMRSASDSVCGLLREEISEVKSLRWKFEPDDGMYPGHNF